MKKKIITVSIIIILTITFFLIIYNHNKQETKKVKTKDIVVTVSNGYINGMSKKTLEKKLNHKLSEKSIITGKDSYLNQKPSEKLIEKYNLSNYAKEQENYINSLEAKIKENYSFSFQGTSKEYQKNYIVKVKTYYYAAYLSDLSEIMKQLLANYDINSEEQENIYNYKAKVIAMRILNNHLNDYNNENETKEVVIDFDNPYNSLSQYLLDLAGYNYTNVIKMDENRTTRVTVLINEYLQNRIIENISLS